ncbi:MAG: recombinase family protein [Acidobacteriaceae bacterium]
MANGKYVVYYRVSTDKQKRSGLGLEAQEEAVRKHLNGGKWSIVGKFTERESGKRDDRPALAEALALCRLHRATLVVAKLDRLARNTKFLLTVVEGSGNAGVVFCDLPTIPEGPVGKFLVTQMASVAELEAGLISQRTKAALQAAKARGVVLGCRNKKIAKYAKIGAKASVHARSEQSSKRASDVMPIIEALRAEGSTSLRQIAVGLNERGIPTARGGPWSAVQVSRILNAA